MVGGILMAQLKQDLCRKDVNYYGLFELLHVPARRSVLLTAPRACPQTTFEEDQTQHWVHSRRIIRQRGLV